MPSSFKCVGYKIESGINFSRGSYTPFWMVSNKQGLSSVTTDNGYIRVGIFRPLEKESSPTLGGEISLGLLDNVRFAL